MTVIAALPPSLDELLRDVAAGHVKRYSYTRGPDRARNERTGRIVEAGFAKLYVRGLVAAPRTPGNFLPVPVVLTADGDAYLNVGREDDW